MRFVAGRGADKVCCRQRRCGEAVAGRDPSAQRTAGRGAAAKSHREDAAGRECHGEEDGGTVAESHREELLAAAPCGDIAGRGTVAEVLLTEAPLQTGKVRRHEPQCL